MNPILPQMQKFGRVSTASQFAAIGVSLLALTAAPNITHAQSTWNGSANTDWNNAANWSAGVPSGVDAIIATNLPNIATISNNFSATPVDIKIGWTGGNGRVDHISGDAGTGNGNWMWVGIVGNTATYNFADTRTTGGTLTGFGQGTGNLNVGGATQNGNILLGLDNGTLSTLNINSSGTIAGGGLYAGAAGGANGIVNMDSGTVTLSGECQIGANFFSQGSGTNNQLNISGGKLTANIISISRGANNGSIMKGAVNLTGGTLESKQWFTLGFAGSSTAEAVVTNSGGTINVNTSGGGNLEMGVWDFVNCSMVVNSGTVNLQNNASIQFGVLGAVNLATFDQNGGAVTFYSDGGTNVGGTGSLNLGAGTGAGTYAYNLNGGTLTVPSIQKPNASAVGAFNFNGGVLRPTASTISFMQGLSAANVLANGAVIDTTNFNITINQTLQDGGGGGGLTKLGNGTLTLNGGYGFTGPVAVQKGALALDAGQSSSGSSISVSNATLNVSLNNGVSSLTAGALTFTGNSTLNLNFGTASSPSAAAINASSVSVTGTNTINITGPALVVGAYPLISTGGSVPTNNFKLGPLPTGVAAVLTNSGTALTLLITASGQNLIWYGANAGGTVLTNWDIAVSTNWNTGTNLYKQYSGNSYGDNVTFDDSLFAGSSSINLATRVVPSSVFFNSGANAYSLAGSGGIDGPTTLVVTNTGSVFIGTSNNFTGGTIVGGSLSINSDTALGNSSGALTLAGGSLQAGGTFNSTRLVSIAGSARIGVSSGATAAFNGSVSGGSLTKVDNGTLALGGVNSYTGPTRVSAGTLNLSGTVSNGTVTVGDSAGNASLALSGTFSAQNLFVGNTNGAFAALRQTAGTATVNGGTGDNLNLGNWSDSYGYFDAIGGTMNVNGISVGGEENPNVWPPAGTGHGLLEVHGGTINNSGWLVLARGGSGNKAVVNVFSGAMTFGGGGLSCNWQLSGADQTSIVNVLGGSLTSTNQALEFRTINTGVLNLNGGLFKATGLTGFGTLNFNGGTLQPAAASANFITMTRANVYPGGATLDDAGTTTTITQPLVAPDGFGVSSITPSDAGSGYIAPPIVSLSGGSGSNATAIATISGGGITAITVTSPGTGYSVSDVLTVSYTGGGATATPPASTTVSLTPNTSGGLFKKGAGSLTLSGANTYTGITLVTNGSLFFTPNQQTATPVVVAAGTLFGISTSSPTNGATIGNLTLGGTGPATLGFSYGLAGNPTNVALTAAAVTVNAGSSIQIGGNFSIGAFPLLKYSTLSALPALVAPRGVTALLSNDVPNTTLYAVVTGVGGGIVWSGTNSAFGVSNKWDINITTNWLTGTTPTTYQEVAPPGDTVRFDDTGVSPVLLSNTVSPLSVTISNSAKNYTFTGNGRIAGTAGITKSGTGSATLAVTGGNTFSGPTVINSGTLAVSGGGAIGDLSPVSLANTSGASLVVSNNETIGSLAGGGASGGNVTMLAGLTTGGNNSNTVFGGTLSGSGTLSMKGTGSMTVTNSVTVTGEYWVGSGAGDNTTLNIGTGGTVSANNWWVIGRSGSAGTVNVNGGSLIHNGSGNLTLGTLGTTPRGTINLNSGIVSNAVGETYLGEGSSTVNFGAFNQSGGISTLGNFYVGRGASGGQGIGNANVTGGTMNVGNLDIGYGFNNARVGTNVMTIGGSAVVNASGFVRLAFAGSANLTGNLTNNGGTLNVGSTALYLSYWPDGCSGHVTHNAGAINLRNNSSIIFGLNGAQFSVNDFVQNGGTVTFYSDAGVTVGGTGSLNLGNSGSANNTYTLAGGTLTVPQIRQVSGTSVGVFNFKGGTLAAAASSATFMQGLAAANVISNAVIDTAGRNITIAQPLLDGGSGGGLTKIGNGILTLNGVSSYTGATLVSAGTLSGTGTIAGGLTNSATLSPGDAGIGALTVGGNIVLQAGSTNTFDVNGTTPANDSIVAGGSVTYGGVLNIVPAGAFTLGQSFTLFSGAGATSASNFSSIQGSPGSGLAFSFTNGVLSVVSGVASNPTNITFSASGGSLSLSWPADHLGWILQAQTNSRSVGLNTNWFDVGGSESVTSTNLPISPADPTVFYRLRKP